MRRRKSAGYRHESVVNGITGPVLRRKEAAVSIPGALVRTSDVRSA